MPSYRGMAENLPFCNVRGNAVETQKKRCIPLHHKVTVGGGHSTDIVGTAKEHEVGTVNTIPVLVYWHTVGNMKTHNASTGIALTSFL